MNDGRLNVALLKNSPRGSRVLWGSESIILAIAERIDKERLKPLLVVFKERGDSDPPLAAEAKKRQIPVSLLELNGRFDVSSISRLKKILLENKINIVHSNEYKSDLIGFLAARSLPVALIATAHGFLGTDPKIGLYELIDINILKRFDRIVAVSDAMKETLVKKGVKDGKIVVIENAIDSRNYDEQGERTDLKKEFGLSSDALIVAGVGRLSQERGYTYLLKAANKVIKERDKVIFLIAGDGALKKKLIREAEGMGFADKVKFLGARKDIIRIFKGIDIFVSSSIKESFGIAIIEAMAAGKPVISTKVGIAPQIIKNNENGILVEPGDPEAIYKGIIALVDNQRLRNEMGALGKESVRKRFSLDVMVKKYEEAYLDLITYRK